MENRGRTGFNMEGFSDCPSNDIMIQIGYRCMAYI